MPIKIFFCYAHEDETLLNQLKAHLRPLERKGLIEMWLDRDINAGVAWESEIDTQLNAAQIILLLVSSDFIDSDYCYSKEMKQALERHNREEARVIPIILRHVYWKEAPFGKLQALPKDGKPVTSNQWHNLDEAFYDIAENIQKVTGELNSKSSVNQTEKLYVEDITEEEKTLDELEYDEYIPSLSPLQPKN